MPLKNPNLSNYREKLEKIEINYFVRLIGLVNIVFANYPEDRGSVPGRIIPKI